MHQQIPTHPHTRPFPTPHPSLPLLLQSGQRGVSLEGIAHGTRPIIPNVVVFQTAEREEVREGINKYSHTHTHTHSPLSNTPHHSLPLLLQSGQRGVSLEGIAHETRPIIPNVVATQTIWGERRGERVHQQIPTHQPNHTLAPLSHPFHSTLPFLPNGRCTLAHLLQCLC